MLRSLSLQISAAHGPAECQQAAAGVMKQLCQAARAAGLDYRITRCQRAAHGIDSAVVALSGPHVEDFAAQWCGTVQWICPSTLRPGHKRKNWFIGIFLLPEKNALPPTGTPVFRSCKASGKGGQHLNKTNSAVHLHDRNTGIHLKISQERSQHRNKQLALRLWRKQCQSLQDARNARHEQAQQRQHWQVERGNPVKIFVGSDFRLQ